MTKLGEYKTKLKQLKNWDAFLLKESGLPGPRANLELVQAVADEGNAELFERYLTYDPLQAPTNSPQVFLAVCGVVGLGRLAAEGNRSVLQTLRGFASDPRWRMREGVAMALQQLGDQDMDALLREAAQWSKGNPLEQRAAAAGICEPRLLHNADQAARVLKILDDITASIAKIDDRKSEAFIALKKGLAYCWSVAVAALPTDGQKQMEQWLTSTDKDIIWIMRENLKKNRLARMDAVWVEKCQTKLARPNRSAKRPKKQL